MQRSFGDAQLLGGTADREELAEAHRRGPVGGSQQLGAGAGQVETHHEVAVTAVLFDAGDAVGGRVHEEHPDSVVGGRRGQEDPGCPAGADDRLGAGEAPAGAIGSRDHRGTSGQVRPLLGHGGGEDEGTRGGAGKDRRLLGVAAELRDDHRRRSVHGQRHGSDGAAHLDQHPAELDEAEPGAVVLLGDREGEESGLGEVVPQGGVDARSGRLHLLLTLVGGALAEDGGGQLRRLVLLGGEGEVHGGAFRYEGASSTLAGARCSASEGAAGPGCGQRLAAGRPRPT